MDLLNTETQKSNKSSKWIIGALAIIALFFILLSINQCSEKEAQFARVERNLDILRNDSIVKEKLISTLSSSVRTLSSTNDEIKKQVYYNDSINKLLLAKFDKVISSTKILTKIKFPRIEGDIKNEISVVENDSIPDCRFFGRENIKGDYFDMDVTLSMEDISKVKVMLDSLTVPVDIYSNIGYVRKGLFQKDEIVTQVTSTNPYVDIYKIQSETQFIETPIYKKWWIWFLTGAATVLGLISIK